MKRSVIPWQTKKCFESHGLNNEDILNFAVTLKSLDSVLESNGCWDLASIKLKMTFKELQHFSASHKSIPLYKGKDARVLILAIFNIHPKLNKEKIIRDGTCRCNHCLNPCHYFYGNNLNVTIERWKRKGHRINEEIYHEVRRLRKIDPKTYTYKALAYKFNLKIHLVESICLSNAGQTKTT